MLDNNIEKDRRKTEGGNEKSLKIKKNGKKKRKDLGLDRQNISIMNFMCEIKLTLSIKNGSSREL